MVSSMAHVLLSTEFCENRLSKFLRNITNKQTNEQKNKRQWKQNLHGGGNKTNYDYACC